MTDDTKGTNRRGFLKLAGTAAPAAIVAAATAAPTTAAANPVDLSSSVMQDKSIRASLPNTTRKPVVRRC
jgi:hypothetical protein